MKKCPNCGVENPDHAKGCKECGTTFEIDDKKESKPKSSNNKMIIAVVAIVVVIAIVGVFASGMLSGDTSSDVSDSSQSVKPIADNNTSDSQATEYWASAKAEKFHLPTCEWAQKISDSNKIVYHSRDDAISDGKVPCTACNP